MKTDKYAFSKLAWDDFNYWLEKDIKNVKKINELLKDIMRNGALIGIGKPEMLKGDKSGWYSRHITQKHRLVYRIVNDTIEISGCRNHYDDK
jgi:toxin YoeB